jgi:hypothetical protein
VVVVDGLAIGVAIFVADKPVAGDQEKVAPVVEELPLSCTAAPEQIV